MEELYKEFLRVGPIPEKTFVFKLQQLLSKGANIDINLTNTANGNYGFGTILNMSIYYEYQKIVQFVIDEGASFAELFLLRHYYYGIDANYVLHPWNSLELAIIKMSADPIKGIEIYKMVKKKSFELYSCFGLHSIHVQCAIGNWSQIVEVMEPNLINSCIDLKSPVWPGMTPILIAAKFNHIAVVNKLYDLGADFKATDAGGNTVLHYMSSYNYCDKKFFIFDKVDTFGDYTGTCHFHIACIFGSKTLDITQKYLDQGESVDVAVKHFRIYNFIRLYEGDSGLNISTTSNTDSPDLPEIAGLLIEYGADMERKDLQTNHNVL